MSSTGLNRSFLDSVGPRLNAVSWSAAFGVILTSRRGQDPSALAFVAVMAAQVIALGVAGKHQRIAVLLSTAIELVVCALGHAPDVGIGFVVWNQGRLLKHGDARGTFLRAAILPIPAILGFVPWLLHWSSGPLIQHTPSWKDAYDTFFVLLFASAIAGNWNITEILARSAREEVEAADAAREQAVADERARIARELHDVVAHQMTVVVAQAQGAEALVDREPQKVKDALSTITNTTRDALVEMRRLVDVGRSGDATPLDVARPQPGLALDDYARLAQGAEDAGLVDVTFGLDLPHRDAELSPAIALSAYRLIQEAITNAAKHSPGSTLAVKAAFNGATLDVDVTNGPPARPATEIPGAGVGLVGMRERVEFFGGTLETGPTADGGWSVRASFPTLEAPPSTS
jgi:signal transduction histidine kinase